MLLYPRFKWPLFIYYHEIYLQAILRRSFYKRVIIKTSALDNARRNYFLSGLIQCTIWGFMRPLKSNCPADIEYWRQPQNPAKPKSINCYNLSKQLQSFGCARQHRTAPTFKVIFYVLRKGELPDAVSPEKQSLNNSSGGDPWWVVYLGHGGRLGCDLV